MRKTTKRYTGYSEEIKSGSKVLFFGRSLIGSEEVKGIDILKLLKRPRTSPDPEEDIFFEEDLALALFGQSEVAEITRLVISEEGVFVFIRETGGFVFKFPINLELRTEFEIEVWDKERRGWPHERYEISASEDSIILKIFERGETGWWWVAETVVFHEDYVEVTTIQ